MRHSFLLFLLILESIIFHVEAQDIHTVYLDNSRNAVFSPEFSSYILKYSDYSENKNLRRFRVSYSTGEVYADGFYNSIDTLNFDKSILGNSTFYYKNGQTLKEIKELSPERKVMTQFFPSGLVASIDSLLYEKLEGERIVFDENHKKCEIYNYHNGSLSLPFYIVRDLTLNTESAFYNNTTEPFFFSIPSKSYQIVKIKDLGKWEIYDNNYMLLAMQYQKVKDHGNYHQIWISLTNYSTLPIEFDPDNIKAIVNRDYKTGAICELYQLDKNEYQNAITKLGFWDYFAIGLTGVAAGFANAQDAKLYNTAGMSSGYINNSYYYNYDATSAIIGQQIIRNRVAARNAQFQNMILSDAYSREQEAQVKTISYLTKTTVKPGEQVVGFINFKYEKGVNLSLRANINGINYDYDFDITKDSFQKGKYKVFDVISNASNTVVVRGLQEDDIIEILNSKGELLHQKEATGNETTIRLREEGVYIIRVGKNYKRVLVESYD